MKKGLIILATAICSINCFAQLPSWLPSDGLVAWYPFTGNAKDSSGNNYNGVVHGATLIKDRFGNLKSAYKFSGTQYIEVPFKDPFVAQSHTISCWIKSNQTKLGRLIALPTSLIGGGDQHFSLNLNIDSLYVNVPNQAAISFDQVNTQVPFGISAFSTSSPNDNMWHNIIGIIDSAKEQMRIYIDGKLEDVVHYDHGPSSYATANLHFGSYDSEDTTQSFTGILDDIAIYNRVLDLNEIQQLYCSCTLPSTTITNKSISEGNTGTKQLDFPVTLSSAYSDTVKIKYKTKNSTAVAGSDYIAKQGTLIFNPGQTTKNIIVTVNGDTQPEANEKFFVLLSQPQNAIIDDDTAVGTIRNDDNSGLIENSVKQESQIAATQHLLTVFPNPAKGKFTVSLSLSEYSNLSGTIEIINMMGQVIHKETIALQSKRREIILPSATPAGIYIVQLKVNNKTYQAKLVYQP